MSKVLLVDDDPEMLESLEKIISIKNNFEITGVSDPHEAVNLIDENYYDLIISDLMMKKISGIELLKIAKTKSPNSVVIIISGYGTIEKSVESIKYGAFDFLEKPFTSSKLFEVISKASEKFETSDKTKTIDYNEFAGIIYKSEKMNALIEMVKKVAEGKMNILITGESGTGKEMIARAIHSMGNRKNNSFVPVNCGSLPEQLFESELFGHEKGAFTGAIQDKPGLLEFANHGTFFFDEIGEMSEMLQVKILRLLEDMKIRHVGGNREIDIDVRIIAASNRNLELEIENHNFRKDLFYRLSTLHLEIPPLRERKEDILPIINFFITQLCRRNKKQKIRFTDKANELFVNYSWPGNVRELQNVLQRIFFLCEKTVIDVDELPIALSQKDSHLGTDISTLEYVDAKEKIIENFEIKYLSYFLKKNNGNISKAAEDCGLSRRSIHRLINKYGIIYKD